MKNLILTDYSASRWLKSYLSAREKIHKKRREEIVSCTKTVQNLLMRTTTSLSPKKDPATYLPNIVNETPEQAAKMEELHLYYRNRNPENLLNQTSEVAAESDRLASPRETIKALELKSRETSNQKRSYTNNHHSNNRNLHSPLRASDSTSQKLNTQSPMRSKDLYTILLILIPHNYQLDFL